MPQNLKQIEGWQVLTAQDLADFEKASQVLCEQLERTTAPPEQQVRMRLALWIVRTELEIKQADFNLFDRLCQHE